LKNALVLYDDVLKDKPGDPDALRDRGVVYMHLAKYREAIRDFEDANKGLTLNPTDFPGFGSRADYDAANVEYKLGNADLSAGKYADAFNHYQAALAKYPYYAKCWHNMAIACSNLGDNMSAELCCIHAISYRPDDWKLWNTLGYALFGEFKQDKSNPTKLGAAASAFQQALALNPTNEQDKSDVRQLLASVKSYERALAPIMDFVITTMPIN
jgi:tetratricopeptide (TPR) repeat protein